MSTYFVNVMKTSGYVDDYEVVDHYFEDRFLHLVHQYGPMGTPKRYTTSLKADLVQSVTTADER